MDVEKKGGQTVSYDKDVQQLGRGFYSALNLWVQGKLDRITDVRKASHKTIQTAKPAPRNP